MILLSIPFTCQWLIAVLGSPKLLQTHPGTIGSSWDPERGRRSQHTMYTSISHEHWVRLQCNVCTVQKQKLIKVADRWPHIYHIPCAPSQYWAQNTACVYNIPKHPCKELPVWWVSMLIPFVSWVDEEDTGKQIARKSSRWRPGIWWLSMSLSRAVRAAHFCSQRLSGWTNARQGAICTKPR